LGRRKIDSHSIFYFKFKVPTYRLTAKAHLYALSDIEAFEERAKHNPPLTVRTCWRKQPPALGRQGWPKEAAKP
jgi:hypothetical protein